MSTKEIIEIPDDILMSLKMTPNDIKIELAVHLYETRRLSIGKAKSLAGVSLWEFQNILASRKIPVNYDIEDYKEDINTLKRLQRIK
ncbi:MAG: UPF0175 family protein [Candidatus Scalindua sp.]